MCLFPMNICSCLAFGAVTYLGCRWQSAASQSGWGTAPDILRLQDGSQASVLHVAWLVGSVFCGHVGGHRVPCDTFQDQEPHRPLLKFHKYVTFIYFQITLQLFK